MTSDQAMRELADKATDGPWEAWTDQDERRTCKGD